MLIKKIQLYLEKKLETKVKYNTSEKASILIVLVLENVVSSHTVKNILAIDNISTFRNINSQTMLLGMTSGRIRTDFGSPVLFEF